MCRKMNHAEFKHLSEKDREGRSPKSKNGDIPSQLIAFVELSEMLKVGEEFSRKFVALPNSAPIQIY